MTRHGSERSLLPREHGAYAELGLPLLSALSIGRPIAPMFLLAAAAVAGFFAYEPLLVLLGQRGARARKEDGARARHRLALLAGLAGVLGAGALALAPPAARWALAVPALPLLLMAVLMAKGRATGPAGALVAAAALASVSVPVAAFGGAGRRTALLLGIVWVVGLASYTLAVRAVLDQGRRRPSPPGRTLSMVLILGAWAGVAAAGWTGWLPWIAPIVLAPLAAGSFVTLIVFPRPQRVAILGWAAVAGSVLTAVLLVVFSPPV